jgi:DNA-directed RNA polymerase specialized sigma24 family protein
MASLQRNTLMDRLIEGDRSALGGLFDRYAGVVNALALRLLGNAACAEDLVRAVFVRAWREAASYDPTGGPPMAWLCAMARERALDRLHGRPVAGVVSVRRPPRALGYYEGLTSKELVAQFGEPDAAIQERQHARAQWDARPAVASGASATRDRSRVRD